MQENKGEEQSQWDGQRGNDSGANTDQKKNEHDKDQDHSADQVPFDGVRGDAHEIAAIVERMDLDVRGKNAAVEFFRFLLDATKDVLGLLAATHKDYAFHGILIVFGFVLEAKNAEARGVSEGDLADIFHADGNAV